MDRKNGRITLRARLCEQHLDISIGRCRRYLEIDLVEPDLSRGQSGKEYLYGTAIQGQTRWIQGTRQRERGGAISGYDVAIGQAKASHVKHDELARFGRRVFRYQTVIGMLSDDLAGGKRSDSWRDSSQLNGFGRAQGAIGVDDHL